ncbi:hypothetical protein BWQ96_05137 [Gracilariopsis chorda]|uniref:DUF6818 domain-containing protein n=1 Tax=Gracilariopsis chorda TaxID=448386 RepID=A0A2V3ISJ8_9FLOR|nr:hypothetical protein BWQ96_05137 [Gracilariopsis chorda]|eukprot:PXF45098.1 hypothetical protein BWQ96_05137 [Gracilariopsis chorda]
MVHEEGAGGGHGLSFTKLELENFLDVLSEHLPSGNDEWEAVTRIHQSRWPNANRSTDSLRRKFAALHRKRVPIGDPRIPSSVLKAEDLREEMTTRVDMGEGEGAETDTFFLENEGEKGPHVTDNSNQENASDVEAKTPNKVRRSTTPSTSAPAFPNIHKRRKRGSADDNAGVTELIKATILQEQRFRAAARERLE